MAGSTRTYVLLLRGVNAGGKRRVDMARLRSVLATLGCQDIATYINYGNVVFSCERPPDTAALAHVLHAEFGFETPFLLLTGEEVRAVAEAIPQEWSNDYTEWKADVVYLFDDVNSPDIIERIGCRPEYEEMRYINHALLSRIARRYQPKSSLMKVIGTELYQHLTVRNVTTARKLADMVRESDKRSAIL